MLDSRTIQFRGLGDASDDANAALAGIYASQDASAQAGVVQALDTGNTGELAAAQGAVTAAQLNEQGLYTGGGSASSGGGGLSDANAALLAGLGGALIKTGGQVAGAVLPSVLAKTPFAGIFSGRLPATVPQTGLMAGLTKAAPYAIAAAALWGAYEIFVKPKKGKR